MPTCWFAALLTCVLFGAAAEGANETDPHGLLRNMTWSIHPPSGTPPAPRSYAAAATAGGALYIFGGQGKRGVVDDMWKYTNGTWHRQIVAGDVPSRTALQHWSLNGNFYIFGGEQEDGGVLEDFWVYSFTYLTWVAIEHTPLPAGRRGGVSFLANASLGLFGGEGLMGALNDMWLYDTTSNAWSAVSYANSPPAGRGLAGGVYDSTKDTLYIFGGRGRDGAVDPLHTLWLFHFATRTWNKAPSTTPSPSPRRGHVMELLSDGSLLIAGGRQDVPKWDAWRWYPQNSSWVALGDKGEPPREGAAVALLSGRFHVFGGWNGSQYLGDLTTIDSTTLGSEKIHGVTQQPSPRSHHSAVISHSTNQMVVFGGTADRVRHCEPVLLSDTWVYHLDLRTWQQLPLHKGPPARHSHAAVSTKTKMVIFGGLGKSQAFNDVWVLAFDPGGRWERMEERGGAVPAPRYDMAMVLLEGEVYVYGGTTYHGVVMDLWRFSLDSGTWYQVAHENLRSRGGPGPLSGHAMVQYPPLSFIVVGGAGEEGVPNNVMAQFHVESTRWSPVTPPLSRAVWHHTATLMSSSSHRMLVVGGEQVGSMDPVVQHVDGSGGNFTAYHIPAKVEGLSGHTTVAYGSRLIIFGGHRRSQSGEKEAGHVVNELWEVELSPLCEGDASQLCWGCSPGTALINGTCTTCPLGTQAVRWGHPCTPCPPGTSGAQCLPCQAGTFQSRAGQTRCNPCPTDRACPLGAAFPAAKKQSTYSVESHPRPLRDRSREIYLMSLDLLYIWLGVSVALILAYIASSLTKRSQSWCALDFLMSDKHRYPEYSFLRVVRTPMGGLLSTGVLLSFICLCLATVLPIVDNEFEWRALIPGFLNEDDDRIPFDVNITLDIIGSNISCRDGAMCIRGVTVTSKNISGRPDTRCRGACKVVYRCTDCVIEGKYAVVHLDIVRDLWASEVAWTVSTSSGYPGTRCSIGHSLTAPPSKAFRGRNPPTRVEVSLTPTVWQRLYADETHLGYHARMESQTPGRAVPPGEIDIFSGLAVEVAFTVELTTLRVSIERLQAAVFVVAVCVGLLPGLMAIAGAVLRGYERLAFRRRTYGTVTRNYGYHPEVLTGGPMAVAENSSSSGDEVPDSARRSARKHISFNAPHTGPPLVDRTGEVVDLNSSCQWDPPK
eukprot:Sspe_Gene.47651::Locus_24410_Transcript_1_1_Confidence_1.000_Length_3649::g.47651::m.47651